MLRQCKHADTVFQASLKFVLAKHVRQARIIWKPRWHLSRVVKEASPFLLERQYFVIIGVQRRTKRSIQKSVEANAGLVIFRLQSVDGIAPAAAMMIEGDLC